MYNHRSCRSLPLRCLIAAFVWLLASVCQLAWAAPPVVKTVPWVATNPLIPHNTYPGKSIHLKGTADVQGSDIQYTWDFGDGTPVATGTVNDKYAIEATHIYTGPIETIYTARLTVRNTSTGETGTKEYYVQMKDKTLEVEVNVAIDEGLWYMHKVQRRDQGVVGFGDWFNWSGYVAINPANVNAFEVNGHVETGSPDNPYTETVARGMKRVFYDLAAYNTSVQPYSNIPSGYPIPSPFNPDSNGNGIGVYVNQYPWHYQGGMFMSAIIASGTPDRLTTTGPANVINRPYKDIVQDLVDAYAEGQYNDFNRGGWRYSWNEFPDNSPCQWAAIGLIPAERVWGLTVPTWVKDANKGWLTYSQNPTTGWFGYTDSNHVWGPYATTPSGMVQLAMNGIGRGNSQWDKVETFIRDNFGNGGGPTTNIKAYYYGLLSFTKAMLLHDLNGDGIAEPIKFLQSSTPGVNPIDWYAAETTNGDPTNGVARTLVNDQDPAGWWWSHDYSGDQYPFDTAFAILMLKGTLFESGAPVAVASATPNPSVAGQTITLSGAGSFHQDAARNIVQWDWDLDNNGTFDATGPIVTTSYPVVGNYPVKLKVTDNNVPPKTAETILIVLVSTPPLAPTADADGPYVFCPQAQPWFLDGTGSINPDDGLSEPGKPGDTIHSYEWDLDGDGLFDDALGAQPDVTAFFTAKGPGGYVIQLKVTDTTAISFPSSGQPNLSDTDSAQVTVKASTDTTCACINNLAARPKSGKVQLTWTNTIGTDPQVHHYNVYRGTVTGGPYLHIAKTTNTYSTYLDTTVVNGTTYYYVVRRAALNDNELCQSNQAIAKPVVR